MWPPVNSQQERGDLSPTARRKKTLPAVRARPGLGRDPQPQISLLEALSENAATLHWAWDPHWPGDSESPVV